MVESKETIEARLQRLRTKLLDLTTTNRMLSYRHPKASCLRVVDELPAQIFDSLMAGDTLVFEPIPEPTQRELEAYFAADPTQVPRASDPAPGPKPDAATWAKRLGLRVNFDLMVETDNFERDERHRDKKIQTLDYADALDARLRKVRAAARTAVEESGANMLYLAFGFLEWRDQSTSKAHQAPLILLPVEIHREARRGGYRTSIRWTGEELQANLSLRKKLEEFGIALPELVDDQSLEDYLTDVARAVRSKSDWIIRRYMTLGLFEFGKILLYLDLDPERWPSFAPITEHPLVQRILSSGDDSEPAGSVPCQDTDADHLFRDLELEVVDRADSSQCEALHVALGGRNLVVQGPPGTGKSQTITNLIAAAMARGKTVLFVAEKLAALEVVRRRLRELGLGDFCLELHSHKTRKTEALEDISDRIRAAARARAPKDYETARQRLESRRQQLSDYIDIIAAPAGQMSGLVVSEALMRGGRARRKLGEQTKLYDPLASRIDSTTVTWAKLADAKSRLSVFQKAFVELGPLGSAIDHPWAGVSAAVAMPNDAARLAGLANAWADAGDRLLALTEHTDWRKVSATAWLETPTVLEKLAPVRDYCTRGEIALTAIETAFGKTLERSTEGAGQAHAILTLAAQTPMAALDLRRPETMVNGLVDWAQALDHRVQALNAAQVVALDAFKEAAFTIHTDDLEEWAAAFVQPGLLAKLGGRWRAAARAWKTLCRPAHLKDPASARAQALTALRDFLVGRAAIESDPLLQTRLGDQAQGLQTRTSDLIALTRWIEAVRAQLPSLAGYVLAMPPERLDALRLLATDNTIATLAILENLGASAKAADLWTSVVDALAPAALRPVLRAFKDDETWNQGVERAQRCATAAADLTRSETAFSTATALEAPLWFGSADVASLEAVVSRARNAVQHIDQLPDWLEFDRARAASRGQLEDVLVDHAVRGDLDPATLPLGLDFLVFDRIARTAFRDAPGLLTISGKSLDAVRSEYRELDARVMELRRAQIAAQLLKAVPPEGRQSGLKSELSEMALIRAELSKQRRHIPIRQLVLRAGKALQTLKPCFMMGPLSVAQYVAPGKLKFDLVIMDEASQMRPEDAIGALARGKQAVIVGDSKQLPPTSFFDRIAEGREDDVEDEDLTLAEDSKSILELAESIFDQRMLRWHYRSRHEALIAFSNRHFYKNDLIVFPSPAGQSDRLGVGWTFVADGATVKGVNATEARTVAKVAARFLIEQPNRSLGVVAMNVKQAQRIADELAALASADPLLGDALAKAENDVGEPFFIKNLENVQGDERDVIMISMTYGPAESGGRTPQNFGPINQGTGWRRLNVLFTRAKERMEIFSTMRSTDIVPKEGGDLGPRALKLFLDYAESGRLGSEPTTTTRPTDSDFEDAVLEGLRELNFTCTPQLGVANFFLDIGVRDPDAPHEFIAAIECDGAAYHSSKSARDRDRLRQEILEGLGWNIIRVWSTDWFRDPQRELDRVVAELQRLVSSRRQQRQKASVSTSKIARASTSSHPSTPPSQQPATARPAAQRPAKTPPRGISMEQARTQLIDIRERKIRTEFPDTDPTRGFLRKSMLDELLRKRPTDNEEFLELIPKPLREQTDGEQLVRYREQVFDILTKIIA